MDGRILKAVLVSIIFAAAVVASEKAGAPGQLPDVAMAWTLLFTSSVRQRFSAS